MLSQAKAQQGSRSPNDIDRLVGSNVRERRQELGLTLQEVASRIGISHQQLQKYETGTNRLSVGLLPYVAAALRIDMTALYGDPEPSEAETADDTARLRAQCEAVLSRAQSGEQLSAMLKVLKAMAS